MQYPVLDPNPVGLKVKEFNWPPFRGPERLVAEPERMKFCIDVLGGSYGTSDDAVVAVLNLSATRDYPPHLVQN